MNINIPDNKIFRINIENATIEMIIESGFAAAPRTLVDMSSHTHAYAEIFVCGSSDAVISSEKGDVMLGKGDIGIVPSGLKHRLIYASDFCRAFGVRFVRRSIPSSADLYGKLTGLCSAEKVVAIKNRPDIYGKLERLYRVSGSEEYLPALKLATILCELADKSKPAAHSANEAPIDKDLNRISRLDGIINSFFMTDLTADSIAERLFISRRQLSRIVKKRYNDTLHNVLVNKRLDVASKMLTKGSDSVSAVALAVGFGSVYAFSRNFEKQYGMTPSEYRKKYAEKAPATLTKK